MNAIDVHGLQTRLVLRVVRQDAGEVEHRLRARAGGGERLGPCDVARHPLHGQAFEGVARAMLEDAHNTPLLEQARDEGAVRI